MIEPALRPNAWKGEPFDTVVIDPGHGGADSGGKTKDGGLEKTYNLDTAQRLGKALQARGIKVIYTRAQDVFVTKDRRVAVANEQPRSILISLHFNTSPTPQKRGIETYFLSGPLTLEEKVRGRAEPNPQQDRSQSAALAAAVHRQSLNATGTEDRGIRHARWTVLQGLAGPGILIEGGFLSTPTESKLIATEEFRQKLAEGICAGVLEYQTQIRGK